MMETAAEDVALREYVYNTIIEPWGRENRALSYSGVDDLITRIIAAFHRLPTQPDTQNSIAPEQPLELSPEANPNAP